MISQPLAGVKLLDAEGKKAFETVTGALMAGFYNGANVRRKLAFGDGIDGISDMHCTVSFRSQSVSPANANRDFPVNTTVYDTQFTYSATADVPVHTNCL
jgi:hypothetical protein